MTKPQPRLILLILSLVLVCAAPAPAQSVEQRMQDALDEMAELERRLEQIDARAQAAQRELDRQNSQIGNLDERMQSRQEIRQEGRVALDLGFDRASRQEHDIAQEIVAERQALDASRVATRKAGAGAAAALESGAPVQSAMPRLLLLRHHADRATVASGRIMRAEMRLAGLENERSVLHEAKNYYTVFSELGGGQLRERHTVLAGRVEALRRELGDSAQTAERLAARRGDLKALVQQLVEQQARADAGEGSGFDGGIDDVVAGAAETPPPQRSTPLEGTIDLIGGDADLPDGPAVADRDLAEGVRRLFWRANPVTVRSLAGGQVVFARPFSGYRHVLIVKHANGWFSVIGNLSRCDVAEGELIAARKALGMYQAVMGRHAEPLWFEVRENATPRAPEAWPALPTGWEKVLFGE
jgi:septal ring factor EnvC (AmiA/AmiB activator)